MATEELKGSTQISISMLKTFMEGLLLCGLVIMDTNILSNFAWKVTRILITMPKTTWTGRPTIGLEALEVGTHGKSSHCLRIMEKVQIGGHENWENGKIFSIEKSSCFLDFIENKMKLALRQTVSKNVNKSVFMSTRAMWLITKVCWVIGVGFCVDIDTSSCSLLFPQDWAYHCCTDL